MYGIELRAWIMPPLSVAMQTRLTLVIKPELGKNGRSKRGKAAEPLEARVEERSRWLKFAELALRKKQVKKQMGLARDEQDRIKQKIQPQIEKYRRLTFGTAKRKTG